MLPIKKNHIEQGDGRLLAQFNDKKNIVGFINSYLNSVQITEDAIFDLLENSSIYTATGQILTNIGKLVGEYRLGKTDEELRNAIIFKIFLNSSEGTPNNLLQAIKILTNANTVRLWEHYPVSCVLYTNGDLPSQDVLSTLQNISPATSGDIMVIHDPDNNAFIPYSLVDSVVPLSVDTGETLVTDSGDEISVFLKLSAGGTDSAILPDFSDLDTTTKGILPCIYKNEVI